MSEIVDIFLLMRTAEAAAEIAALQEQIDGVQESWSITRSEVMQGLALTNVAISLTLRIASNVVDEAGKNILKIVRSLLTVVNATVSAMLAVAAGYAATGVLAGVGAVLAGFAAGLSAGQSLRILEVEAQLSALFANATRDMDALSAGARTFAFLGGARTG